MINSEFVVTLDLSTLLNTSIGNSDEDGDNDTGPRYVESDAPPSDDDGETAPEVGFEDSDVHYMPSEEDES
jgi:hypothetical protein